MRPIKARFALALPQSAAWHRRFQCLVWSRTASAGFGGKIWTNDKPIRTAPGNALLEGLVFKHDKIHYHV
jgi:hypothetical protein